LAVDTLRVTYDKVLVTGGLGFIGSHTVDALLRAETQTWVLDDQSTGSNSNLALHRHDRNLHIVRGSICNPQTIDKIAKKAEAIIHLAAVVSPFMSVQRPDITNNVNVGGTLNVLRSAVKHDINRVVLASSSSVYGDLVHRGRIPESSQTNPISPYGASKLATEKYGRAFSSTYGISPISLRYFNIYGERQKNNPYSGVIAIFVGNLLRNKKNIVFGDGEQTRDFTNVSDVARANLSAMEVRKRGAHEINIGTGVPTSINNLYALIVAIMKIKAHNLINKSARRGDIRDSCANIATAKSILNFEPKIELKTGLTRLIRWVESSDD